MSQSVILLNGSPRGEGNTKGSLLLVAKELEREGIAAEIIQLGGMRLYGCQSCNMCRKMKDRRCAYDDGLNEILKRVFAADGLVIGSPTYYSNVTAEVKAFIDRCGYVQGASGGLMRNKVGAAVVAVRRSGGNFTYAAINYFFGICQMPIATSTYWNMTLALDPGDVMKDEEGIETFQNLGRNMAWMIKKLKD